MEVKESLYPPIKFDKGDLCGQIKSSSKWRILVNKFANHVFKSESRSLASDTEKSNHPWFLNALSWADAQRWS